MNEDDPFHAMAERIGKIEDSEFAGAAVIQPPGGGEPISFLTVDPKADLIQFWASVKSRVEIAYAEAMERSQPAGGSWGR